MSAPRPETISRQLFDEIVNLVSTGKQYPDDSKLAMLEHEAKQLAKANLRDGYMALATLSMLRGNFNDMESRYSIAKNQGLSAEQKLNYVTTLAHAGFFSKAAEILNSIVENVQDPVLAAVKAILCFQLQAAAKLIAKAEAMKIFLPTEIKSSFLLMKDATERMGLSDEHLVQLADCAGEVLRDNHVYYLDLPALNYSLGEGENEFIAATYDVPVSCDQASEMTYLLAEKLLMRGMDVQRFGFRFRGSE